MTNNNSWPSFSLVVAVHDQADILASNLPLLLKQEYEGQYEVIVVDEHSTDNTADVLLQLQEEHKRLYTTFVPQYQFQQTPQRLAYTIGVKASKYDWIVLCNISTPPPNPSWLAELAPFAVKPAELLLGYIAAKNGDVRLQSFDTVGEAKLLVSKAERQHAKAHDGQWLRYLRGKYDFAVVRHDRGHELLKQYDCAMSSGSLLWQRVKGVCYNLFH
jgi:glycosyltransferase involved in cell wall biosynthesis